MLQPPNFHLRFSSTALLFVAAPQRLSEKEQAVISVRRMVKMLSAMPMKNCPVKYAMWSEKTGSREIQGRCSRVVNDPRRRASTVYRLCKNPTFSIHSSYL